MTDREILAELDKLARKMKYNAEMASLLKCNNSDYCIGREALAIIYLSSYYALAEASFGR